MKYKYKRYGKKMKDKIVVDFNCKVENENKVLQRINRTEGEVMRNNNGEKIIELCVDLIITNKKFRLKNIHKYTKVEQYSILDTFMVMKKHEIT